MRAGINMCLKAVPLGAWRAGELGPGRRASARKEWKPWGAHERRPGSQEEQTGSVASVKLDKPHESLLVLFY